MLDYVYTLSDFRGASGAGSFAEERGGNRQIKDLTSAIENVSRPATVIVN